MVDRFIMLILAMAVWNASAQNGEENPFPRVTVPDSIAVKLKKAYEMLKLTFTILSTDSIMILKMGYILSRAWVPISPEEYSYSTKDSYLFSIVLVLMNHKRLFENFHKQ